MTLCLQIRGHQHVRNEFHVFRLICSNQYDFYAIMKVNLVDDVTGHVEESPETQTIFLGRRKIGQEWNTTKQVWSNQRILHLTSYYSMIVYGHINK